ncbi:MAG: acylneuraminate cytidylyltransferase family protein [Omnitrophica WOR_2 bacterium]|jgi:N-acylneuraminate cytidylyltransferase
MRTLFIIPARAGSKGIIKKNTRILAGKPLVVHTLLLSRMFSSDNSICVTTDDPEVVDAVAEQGYKVPFIRPADLSNDSASMRDVMLHALNHYNRFRDEYNKIVLLQPTSPFRQSEDIFRSLSLYKESLDMVVTVMETKANPYSVLYEENEEGFLAKSKTGNFTSRQETPKVWQLNGAVYVINAKSLQEKPISEFTKVKKVEMDQLHSIDLDTEIDWKFAELLNEEYKILH